MTDETQAPLNGETGSEIQITRLLAVDLGSQGQYEICQHPITGEVVVARHTAEGIALSPSFPAALMPSLQAAVETFFDPYFPRYRYTPTGARVEEVPHGDGTADVIVTPVGVQADSGEGIPHA